MFITRRLTSIMTLATLAGGLGASAVQAAPLYGADYGNAGNLYGIDTGRGSASVIANIGTNIGDLTSDTRAGSATVWGVDLVANTLVTFDPATGSATGSLSILDAEITSIAFDVTTGTLFGNDTLTYGRSSNLYTIDPVTGGTSLVGSIGYSSVFGLGFDQAGNLFGIDDSSKDFLQIDTLTAASTLITTGLFNGAFDLASDPDTGIMYVSEAFAHKLHTIDLSTGATTYVGPYGNGSNIAGLAFGVAAVPVPAALPLMVLGLGALGMARRRRRAA